MKPPEIDRRESPPLPLIHPVEFDEMIGVRFIEDAECEFILFPAIKREKDLDGIVDVAVILEHGYLIAACFESELFEFYSVLWQGDVVITFFHEELTDHLKTLSQRRTGENGCVLVTIAVATNVFCVLFGKMLSYCHSSKRVNFFPLFFD